MVRYLDIAESLEADLRAAGGSQPRPLPSENELCSRFGASRTTIRAALDRLEKQGLIERRQGSGTFFRPPQIVKHLGSLVDFHTESRAAGRTPRTRLISLERRKATTAEFALFGAEAAHDGVGELLRLRCLDDQPAVLQRSYVSARYLGPEAESELNNASLYRYLFVQHGLSAASIEETLEPVNVAAGEAALLEIPEGSAVFRSHRTARDRDGRVIEVSDNLVRGDLYRFSVHRRLGDDEP
ncbi:GntR family transcriptional regulator [Terrarubrum flagellatum]|uniref:GntR family transcriptional regulator n=1 Tax=Terrirubrum flagellatum TaxID=2895980 RepID=UPI0031452055